MWLTFEILQKKNAHHPFAVLQHQPHYDIIIMGKQNSGGGSSQQTKKNKNSANHPDRAVQEKYIRDLHRHFRSVYKSRLDASLAPALARPTCHVALINPRTPHAQVELLFGSGEIDKNVGEERQGDGGHWRRLIPHSNLI
jgi:hypothetical protein